MGARGGMRGQPTGLTLLEFTLLIVIMSVALVFFVERVIALRAEIERAALEQTIGAMQSRLSLEFAELTVDGETERIRAWAGGNALKLLQKGRDAPVTDSARMAPGEWAYDPRAGEIVYRPEYPELLAGSRDAEGRWRVVVAGDDNPTGLHLKPVEPLLQVNAPEAGD